jgi:hypothetical protein
MWSVDICSFQCLLKFLSLTDIMHLRLVNRGLYAIIRYNCKSCSHIDRVSSTDIYTISNEKLFPNLNSFSTLTVSHTLLSMDASRLMQRWHTWQKCNIDTKSHSRKALKIIMLKIKGIRQLKISIHQHTNMKYIECLKSALFCCFRRNYANLHHIDIACHTMFESIIKPLSKSNIKCLQISTRYITNSNLQMLCTCIPQSLETLIVDVNQLWSEAIPYFLLGLSRHRLKVLALNNCISEYAVFFDPMGIISYFCDTTCVEYLGTNFLRYDHIDMLASRHVQKVETTVVGVSEIASKRWLNTIPTNYNIRIL